MSSHRQSIVYYHYWVIVKSLSSHCQAIDDTYLSSTALSHHCQVNQVFNKTSSSHCLVININLNYSQTIVKFLKSTCPLNVSIYRKTIVKSVSSQYKVIINTQSYSWIYVNYQVIIKLSSNHCENLKIIVIRPQIINELKQPSLERHWPTSHC